MKVEDVLAQGVRLSKLLDESGRILDERRRAVDHIYHSLQASFVFQEGANPTEDLVFNVPDGVDFEAARLCVFPEVRVVPVDPSTQGPTDLVFRPCGWVSDFSARIVSADLRLSFPTSLLEALVDVNITDADGNPRRYNNAGFFAAQTFSGVFGGLSIALFGGPYAKNAYASGLVFDPLLELRGGATFTARFTPLFSGARQPLAPGDGRIHEYRIRGILEGYKRVMKK